MTDNIKIIGICGVGFVGNAILQTFKKLDNNLKILCFDLYKNIGLFDDLLKCDLIFICLPTLIDETTKKYNTIEIDNTLIKLNDISYNGIVVIKSTTEPGYCEEQSNIYKKLNIIHNPEFLSAKTAIEDFNNQKHIIIGTTKSCPDSKILELYKFYNKYFINAKISICNSTESETTKLFCNSFYAMKIQFFTELYDFSNKMEIDFEEIKKMMLLNGWINPMHTEIPGHDGKISYGGLCFPKDTIALLSSMKKINSYHNILESVINERSKIRND